MRLLLGEAIQLRLMANLSLTQEVVGLVGVLEAPAGEQQHRVAEADAVVLSQRAVVGDAMPIEEHAVSAVQIDNDKTPFVLHEADFQMLPGDFDIFDLGQQLAASANHKRTAFNHRIPPTFAGAVHDQNRRHRKPALQIRTLFNRHACPLHGHTEYN